MPWLVFPPAVPEQYDLSLVLFPLTKKALYLVIPSSSSALILLPIPAKPLETMSTLSTFLFFTLTYSTQDLAPTPLLKLLKDD